MDLRSLIDKLDAIEQTQILTESEELMERVGLRLQDIEQAVGRELDGNKRAAIIGDFARKFGYAGLFDPVSGKFVNKDGKFASFGAYQSEVEQLEDEGLIPNSAKTDALLGFMGKDEKAAKPTAFARADLFGAIDKADGLLDKALDGILESKGIANSLLAEFGINTQLLEAITPEEHQFLKKTVKDAESIKHKADASNLITRYTKEYVPARNRLIKQIQTVIAAIKPSAKSTAPAPAAERSGSSVTANESIENNLELLLELSLTPQGQKAGAKLFEPSATGYLDPKQVQHNLALLKKGHAKLDWNDHVGKTVKDWANMATFDMADRLAAGASSAFDPNTTYAKEREKQKAIDQAYNQDPNALNLRTAASAAGYNIDASNPIGNMTAGDVLGLLGPSGVTAVFNAGSKVAARLGLGTAGKLTTGAATVLGTDLAVKQIDNLAGVGQDNRPVNPQPVGFNKNIKAFQDEVLKTDKKAFPKFGPDGKMGGEVRAAIAKYPEIAKKYGLVKATATTTQTVPDRIEPGQNARDDLLARDQSRNDVNQSAVQTVTPSGDTQVAAADSSTNAADARLPNGANGAHADATAQSQVAAADQIDPAQVQTAVAQLGIKDQITPDQLLALADKLGIKDGEQVADAGSNASNATANTITGPNMSGGASNASRTSAGGDGGLVQGTTATAESLELNRILALSGLTEDYDIDEGKTDGGMKFASWVIDKMIASGPRGQRLAKLANEPLASKVATAGELRAARKLAKEIEAKGPASAVAKTGDDAASAVAKTGDDAASAVAGKTDDAAKAVAGKTDDAAKAVAGKTDDAAKVVAGKTDDAVSKLTSQAAKGEGLLYNVGKLGGRFVRLIKNNKFVSLLAALAALGIILYVANKDDKVDPNKVDPNKVNPHPVPVDPNKVDPKEEERKRQLADLEKLLAQLYGGWPTDPETAETIRAGIAAGAKAPAGFQEGGVQAQPASGTSSSGSDRVFGGRGQAMSAQDLAAASSK
jgi:hypothetical protein